MTRTGRVSLFEVQALWLCDGASKNIIRTRVQEKGLERESGADTRNKSEVGLSRSEQRGLGYRLCKWRCRGLFIVAGRSKPVSCKTQALAARDQQRLKISSFNSWMWTEMVSYKTLESVHPPLLTFYLLTRKTFIKLLEMQLKLCLLMFRNLPHAAYMVVLKVCQWKQWHENKIYCRWY